MITILLATYRPREDRLREQRASVLSQYGVEVRILEREDVAGDGACCNFAALMTEAKAGLTGDGDEYFAFCDQDDIWMPDKLLKELRLMKELESHYGRDTPCLVFGDARVVDADLKEISPSLFRYSNIDPSRTLPRQLVQQNVASGMAMFFNAALLKAATPVPASAYLHDHWVILVASLRGKIACLHEPTVLYRQHSGNTEGAGHYKRRTFAQRRRRLYANFVQAAELPEFAYLQGFERRNWFMRRWLVVRYGLWKCGLVRNLGTLLII